MVTIQHKVIKPEPGQRVFFCGDVHGDKVSLEKQLEKIGFVERQDILIFTGDLIDRGDHSAELIKFATCTPGIYSVIGNHESLFLHGLQDPLTRSIHTGANVGGGWIEQYSQSDLEGLAELIQNNMSISLTVETEQYKIGVVHASAPNDWQKIVNGSSLHEEQWLWSRGQFEDALAGKIHVVTGVDAVVHGHVANTLVASGNHVWIDTQYHTGELTIIEASRILDCVRNKTEMVDSTVEEDRLKMLGELSKLDQELDLGY